MEIDVNRIISNSPSDVFEAIDQLGKTQQELITAIYMIISIVDNEQISDSCNKRAKLFLNKFC